MRNMTEKVQSARLIVCINRDTWENDLQEKL